MKGPAGLEKGESLDPGKARAAGSGTSIYNVEHRGQIYLMFLFAKNQQVDLSAAQKRELKEIASRIRKGG